MSGVPAEAIHQLLGSLDLLEIHYMVGGSAASGVHGWARMTRDVDLVVRITLDDVEPLVEVLSSSFYVDAGEIRTAIRYRRAFNVIHFASAFKFDLFPLGKDVYEQKQFGRRSFAETTVLTGEPLEFAVASPEDVILSKLRWYRLGGETSEKQWNDVLGVIAVQRANLDMDYLREWARYLKIDDLLEKILKERHEPIA